MSSNDAMDWRDRLKAMLEASGDELPEPTEQQEEMPASESKGPAENQTQRLDIIFERKGRAGKTATIITGFTISDEEIDALAGRLKKRLGTGGSARGGEILIQGDRRKEVLDFLGKEGFKARII